MSHPVVARVEDPADDRVAAFVGCRDRELRRAGRGEGSGLFLTEGDRVVERALAAGHRLRSVLIAHDRPSPLPPHIPPGVPVLSAGPEVVRAITGRSSHSGCLALFERPAPSTLDAVIGGRSRVVVCESIQNPVNLGVIFRTAAGLGAEALIIDSSTADPFYRRCSRVAMGEVFAVPWVRVGRFPEDLTVLHERGFTTVALTPDPLCSAVDEVARATRGSVALVLGAEGPGLTPDTLAACGTSARIPLGNGVDSLNVGAAAAIACWEFMGRRG